MVDILSPVYVIRKRMHHMTMLQSTPLFEHISILSDAWPCLVMRNGCMSGDARPRVW